MTAPVDLDVEQRLEVFDVLVVNAEKRFQAPWWSSIGFNYGYFSRLQLLIGWS
jgi:hypothetical protein